MEIAILLTVYNRVKKTINCLSSIYQSKERYKDITVDIFITNDGSTDTTEDDIKQLFPQDNIYLLKGSGNLYWNGGMINSWKAAINKGKYDGYLWLNNDTEIFPNLWDEIKEAELYSRLQFGQSGIYVGSTCNKEKTRLTYGGFNYISKWTLSEKFIYPNGNFQNCQCAHGNVIYVSHNVVEKQGILYDKYLHAGGDHDYTYRAYKQGIPLFVLRDFVGICEKDHNAESSWEKYSKMNLRNRIKYLNSPLGYNLKNTLLFQKRCFPYRYPFVLFMGFMKAFFPKSKLIKLNR